MYCSALQEQNRKKQAKPEKKSEIVGQETTQKTAHLRAKEREMLSEYSARSALNEVFGLVWK